LLLVLLLVVLFLAVLALFLAILALAARFRLPRPRSTR
jgi:hypothetical protein